MLINHIELELELELEIGSNVNNVHYKVWDKITYPFPNFNVAAAKIGTG